MPTARFSFGDEDNPRPSLNATVAAAPSEPKSAEPNGSRVLTPDEELEFVCRLGSIRLDLERMLRPVCQTVEEDVRLDHFDQKLQHYTNIRNEIPSDEVKQIDGMLGEYNRIKHVLVLSNLPWVTKLARTQRQSTVGEEDLFQEGVCGLLKAIDRFESERGLRLMTYATWYIREAMQQVRARQSHLVALSAHDQTLIGQMEAQKAAFQHEHKRAPTTKELGANLRGSARSISCLQAVVMPAVSLDRGAAEGTIPVAVADPVDEFDRQDELNSALIRLLDVLPSRERMVVTRRFGLDGHEPTSLEVLGGDLNVSKERVRQLQRQAIKRMQRRAEDEELELMSV